MADYRIAPSILSADFARLGEDVKAVLDAGADWVHFDVMDNHYVPNLTIGPMGCKALRAYGITADIDVHLMVSPVDRIVGDFLEAGASWITFHPEASQHPHRTLEMIRAVRQKLDTQDRPIRLEVDGGIGPANLAAVAEAGADTFVAGSAIFGSEDYGKTLAAFREALAGVS
jgi:ribulose-phosphate 3-epimerase